MNAIDQPVSAPSPTTASPAVPRRQFLATTALTTSFSIAAPAVVFGASANSKVTSASSAAVGVARGSRTI